MGIFADICQDLDNIDMNEIINEVTVKEIGARFAKIRQKLELSQQQVADILHSSQTRVSTIERGENSISSIFLAMELFYLQHVNADLLFARKFDVDDPHLFDKDYSLASVARERLKLFKVQMKEEVDEKLEDLGKRLDTTIDYL